MQLTKQQIKEIAENLDCGEICYYNLKTGEIKTLPDFSSYGETDMEIWEESINEIEQSIDDYFVFERLQSYQSYEIMADFAESVEDINLQKKLINALNRPKPFRNFMWNIDNSGDYRQKWFQFKNKRYIQWVTEQIESYDKSVKDS
ncbi:MAG: hypothetical protein JXR36_09950 [Bacteroidales bacterium]|nr:hypothetical protein [Bacteroidales bacterium]